MRTCDFVSLCVYAYVYVRALKDKRLELSTPNFVVTQCMAVAGHALILSSQGRGHVVIKCAAGAAYRFLVLLYVQ